MSLGKISRLAIKFGPPTDTLYVAEGLEDAMTAQQASEGESSAWAAAGSSNMPNLVSPDAVKTVVFPGQNDKDDPRQRDKTFEQNLAKAAPKLMSEGKAVRVAWPPAGVKDINDLVRGRTGAALAEGYADVKRMIDSAEEVLPADDDDAAGEPCRVRRRTSSSSSRSMTANCSMIRRASATLASARVMTAALTARRTSSSRAVSGSGSCTRIIATRLALPTQTQCRPR
jgi:hypothetical protein